jgi:hypothetical protein
LVKELQKFYAATSHIADVELIDTYIYNEMAKGYEIEQKIDKIE